MSYMSNRCVLNISFCKYFRAGYSHQSSYAYGDAHKCNKPCDCAACCCDSKKDILCDLLQIVLMIMIIQMVMAAIALSPDIIPPRRKRRRRSLEGFTNSLKVIRDSEKMKETLSIIYRLVLAIVTNLLEDGSKISEIGFDPPWSTYEISYNREPRIFFGSHDNDPPKPDLCKKKCCLKCCKKDKILCIIQVVLLIIIIILLTILIFLLVVLDFVTKKRRRRSVSKQQSLWIYSTDNITGHNFYFDYRKPTWDRSSNDIDDIKNIDEVGQNIRDALSSIVRTRDFSIDLRHMPSKCQTCIKWSVFDLGYEYGPFVVHSAIPKILQPLLL